MKLNLPKINFRSPLFIIILVLILLTIIGIVIRLLTPPPQPAFTYQNFRPGSTTTQELTQMFGSPISQETTDNGTILKFTSDYIQDPHVAIVDNNKSTLLIQKLKPTEEINIKSYASQLGQPSATLYTDYLGPYYPVYVYPDKGIALGTHEYTGRVVEIWYFQPMSLAKFQQLSPYPLSTTPPKVD